MTLVLVALIVTWLPLIVFGTKFTCSFGTSLLVELVTIELIKECYCSCEWEKFIFSNINYPFSYEFGSFHGKVIFAIA